MKRVRVVLQPGISISSILRLALTNVFQHKQTFIFPLDGEAFDVTDSNETTIMYIECECLAPAGNIIEMLDAGRMYGISEILRCSKPKLPG